MASDIVRYDLRDGLAVLTMDDGRANALSFDMLAALNDSLSRAEAEAAGVLLVGRPGRFCAGFDLKVMTGNPEGAPRLVREGAELLLRMYLYPRPLSVACTGHALAAGALLLLVADRRIAADGDFKIGLNEVAIQMTLPNFAVELARDRLSRRHFTAATTQAQIYSPVGAVDAGFVDAVVEPDALAEAATAEARRLGRLPDPAFRNTKHEERSASVARIRERLDGDIPRKFGSA